MLKDMFGGVEEEIIRGVLMECHNDVERAIDCLLNITSMDTTTTAATTTIPTTKPTTTIPTTTLITTAVATTTTNINQEKKIEEKRELTQLELDELLARELASEGFSSQEGHRGDSYLPVQYYQQRKPPVVQDTTVHSVSIENLDPAVIGELLESVKANVIPVLVAQFQKVEIPPLAEDIDAGKLGKISIAINEISVSEARVPKEHIDIVMEGTTFKILAKELDAKLKQFKWSYEKHSFPKLKDSGNADASVSEATISVYMKLATDELGNPHLTVTNCEVNIGQLDIKVSGTMASFIYNSMLAIFKSTIKNTLETSLSQMISNSVNNDPSIPLFTM